MARYPDERGVRVWYGDIPDYAPAIHGRGNTSFALCGLVMLAVAAVVWVLT